MKRHWNEMQPADAYQVTLHGCIDMLEQKIIALLYQPLIGPHAFSLYATLLAEVNETRFASGGAPHYDLMNTLGCGPQKLYEERLKLEGIGLLKTYVKKEDGTRLFLYEVQPPLAPEQFFTDGLLNVFLYRKVGKAQFTKLRQLFCGEDMKRTGFQDVTRDFPDVFSTGYVDAEEAARHSRPDDGYRLASKQPPQGPVLPASFDFGEVERALKDALIPPSSLTPFVKETIQKLSVLYGISAAEMKRLVLSAITDEDAIDVEELRKLARNLYQFESGGELPDMTPRRTVDEVKREAEPKTKEERLARHCESVTPYQMMIDISGRPPSDPDMKLIEQVMLQYGFSPGVMNVLIQYVMLQNDKKLTRALTDKIAGHWVRKNFKTAAEVIAYLKKDRQEAKERVEKPKKQTNSYGKKAPIRTEKLPSWFTESNEPAPQQSADFEERKRKLQEELRKRKERAAANETN